MERNSKQISIIFWSVLLLLIISSSNQLFAANKTSWWNKLQQLTVLESNRSKLEKLFSPVVITYERKFEKHVEIVYETREGDLFVGYSLGNCSLESDKNYSVLKKDVLIQTSFTPKRTIKISTLKIDLSGFVSVQEEDSEVFYYRSKEKGIEYVIRNKMLESVTYSIPNQTWSMLCK